MGSKTMPRSLAFPPVFTSYKRLRSWRRPLPPASVRHKNTSRSKDQEVQWLRRCPLQRLYKFILDHDKIFHSCNYLIFGSFQIPVDSFSEPLAVIGWRSQP